MEIRKEKSLSMCQNHQRSVLNKMNRDSRDSKSNIPITVGKVRQILVERRQKAGVDRSYPLDPLNSMNRALESDVLTKNAMSVEDELELKNNRRPIVDKLYRNSDVSNIKRSGYDAICKDFGQQKYGANLHNSMEKLEIQNMDTMVTTTSKQGRFKTPATIKLLSKTQTNVSNITRPTNHDNKKKVLKESSTSSKLTQSLKYTTTKTPPTEISIISPAIVKKSTMSKFSAPRSPSPGHPSTKQSARSAVVRDDLAECNFCGRRFATDRVQKHEEICSKTGKKKRKAYDTTKHRVLGTELESYILKPGGKKTGINNKNTKSTIKKDWRKTHEEFIAAIRAAKETQAHLSRGGKLADLPPPPPSSNPDYIQCPHCGRRFNEAAADRHIPKCASYQFNKPKPGSDSKQRITKK